MTFHLVLQHLRDAAFFAPMQRKIQARLGIKHVGGLEYLELDFSDFTSFFTSLHIQTIASISYICSCKSDFFLMTIWDL